jgi:hypothetical protein
VVGQLETEEPIAQLAPDLVEQGGDVFHLTVQALDVIKHSASLLCVAAPTSSQRAASRHRPAMPAKCRRPFAKLTQMCPQCIPGVRRLLADWSKSLILLALPTEVHHFGDINGLVPSLGKYRPIDSHSVSGGRPKQVGPPETETAAPAGTGRGGEAMEWLGCYSKVDNNPIPRIIATHYGLEAGVVTDA